LGKVYKDKRPRKGEKQEDKNKEFPNETQRDPLDEEADANVEKMLKGKECIEQITSNVGQERYYGKIEYKLTLFEKDKQRIKHLTTQLNFRLNEGKGQAIYKVGVEDNGNPVGITDEHLKGSLSIF
jgi:hypothetical protein